MYVHTCSLLGLRPSNEDEVDIVDNTGGADASLKPVLYLGIYDGHGGPGISKVLKKTIRLSQYYMHNTADDIAPSSKWNRHMIRKYKTIQQKLADTEPKAKTMGSTALVVIAYEHKGNRMLKVVNLGDSRAVACNHYKISQPLTRDHKPDTPDERQRIAAAGGKIEYSKRDDPRINGLSVSRVFGDLDCEHISSEPECFDYRTDGMPFVIMGCDGLWDVMSDQDAVNFVLGCMADTKVTGNLSGKSSRNIAQRLAEHALERGSQDNVSVIILFF